MGGQKHVSHGGPENLSHGCRYGLFFSSPRDGIKSSPEHHMVYNYTQKRDYLTKFPNKLYTYILLTDSSVVSLPSVLVKNGIQ